MLKASGIDYNGGMKRFMGDEELYEEALLIFTEQVSTDAAHVAFDGRDFAAMFDAVHALKGAIGQMNMPICYARVCDLTELLRNAPYNESDIADSLSRLDAALVRAKQGIFAAL